MSPIELFWTAKKPCYRFPKVDDWRKDSNASSQWDRNMISLWNKSKWQASQIWGNQCEIQMLVFNEKEIWFHCKTNPYDWFPKFEAVGESPFNFEGVFRHFVMNFSDSFWLQTSFKAYGRANPSKKRELQPVFTELRPIKDSAAALRGSPQPSQYLSDSKKISTNTEMAMLSMWSIRSE